MGIPTLAPASLFGVTVVLPPLPPPKESHEGSLRQFAHEAPRLRLILPFQKVDMRTQVALQPVGQAFLVSGGARSGPHN